MTNGYVHILDHEELFSSEDISTYSEVDQTCRVFDLTSIPDSAPASEEEKLKEEAVIRALFLAESDHRVIYLGEAPRTLRADGIVFISRGDFGISQFTTSSGPSLF